LLDALPPTGRNPIRKKKRACAITPRRIAGAAPRREPRLPTARQPFAIAIRAHRDE
jgi:hypothetical protein